MEVPSVFVRAARPADHPWIVDFNAQLASETEDKSLDRERLSCGVATLLSDPAKGRYFIAEVDRTPVAQLLITAEWSDWRNGMLWWLGSVYVVPQQRRRGVFRRLYEHVLAAAQADPGVAGLRLYVEHHNDVARQVYSRCGLGPAGYDVLERLWDR